MKTTGRAWSLQGALIIAGLAAVGVSASDLAVTKTVDHHYAPPAAVLTYAISVANLANPEVDVGLFTDDFPDQLAGCSWTCSAAAGAWCEIAGGIGDVSQLLSVPVGGSVSFAAMCTFVPSNGHECAANVASFFTMDPDTNTRGFATTCEAEVTVFFDAFETGDTSAWWPGSDPRRSLRCDGPCTHVGP